jgi:HAD superfamily hydrolase (TIGR01484 family)
LQNQSLRFALAARSSSRKLCGMRIRLISTDFDGTLVGHPGDGSCVPELASALSGFKASGGLWAINTGRSLEHVLEGVSLLGAPVEPDFLLTHEREIYHRDALGNWRDFGDWNRICRERHAELFLRSGPVFDRIHALVDATRDVTLIYERESGPAGLITSDEEVMDRVTASLDAIRTEFPDFHYQRNTIYLRFCHRNYDKGSALGELSRLLEIEAADIFAAGDHYNDLPMLSGKYARHVGCPANAIPEVKRSVRNAGGHISAKSCGAGVAETLCVTMNGVKTKPAAL